MFDESKRAAGDKTIIFALLKTLKEQSQSATNEVSVCPDISFRLRKTGQFAAY